MRLAHGLILDAPTPHPLARDLDKHERVPGLDIYINPEVELARFPELWTAYELWTEGFLENLHLEFLSLPGFLLEAIQAFRATEMRHRRKVREDEAKLREKNGW